MFLKNQVWVVMGTPVLNLVDDDEDGFQRHLGILVVVFVVLWTAFDPLLIWKPLVSDSATPC